MREYTSMRSARRGSLLTSRFSLVCSAFAKRVGEGRQQHSGVRIRAGQMDGAMQRHDGLAGAG